MKNILIILFLAFTTQLAQSQPYRILDGQTVFGEPTQPDPAAIFQVESTEHGFLPPRLTSTQRDALETTYGTLPIGLQIYNTTEFGIQVWNGSGWIGFLGGVTGFGSENCMAVWAADATPELEDSQFCVVNLNELRIVTDTPADVVDMVLAGQSGGVLDFQSKAEANAGLDVNGKLTVTSTTEGSTPCPVMTEVQRDALTPATGECVYNSDTDQYNIYDGTAWILVGGGGLAKWTASTEYEVDEVVWEPTSDLIYVANTLHTSGATFSDANWDELANQFLLTNLRIAGNTLSSNDTDGNIILAPDGLGEVELPSVGATRVPYTNATNELVGEDAFSYNDTTDILSIGDMDFGAATVTTTANNDDLVLNANGTGSVDIQAPLSVAAIGTNQVAFGDATDGTIDGGVDFLYDAALDKLRAGALDFEASDITTPLTDTDISISPKGIGEIKLNAPTLVDDVQVTGSGITGTDAAADLTLTPATGRRVFVDGETRINELVVNDATAEITTNTSSEDIKFLRDGAGELKVSYNTVEQDLDPQLQFNSIVENGGFEKGVSNISCTDATVAPSTDVSGGVNNNQSALITITAASAECDITLDISNVDEGVNFYAQIFGKTSLDTVEFCPVIDTFEQTCVSFLDSNAWDKYTLETKAGATSAVLRIKGGASTSGTIGIDQLNAQTGGILRRNLLEARTVVRGAGNGGESITASTTDIPFTEVEDAQGLWDGDSFTAPKDGDYLVSGGIRGSASVTNDVFLYVNGSSNKRIGERRTDDIHVFSGVVSVSQGDVLSIRVTQNNITLVDTDAFHNIHIQKIPATEENVITPAKSSTTETKILSADVTSAGDVAGLQFSDLKIGDKYILTGAVQTASLNGAVETLRFRSGAGNTGEIYGTNKNEGNNGVGDRQTTSPSIIFTASSETMYTYGEIAVRLYGDGTREETFLQLTNLNAEFLAATSKPYTLGTERVTDRTLKGKKVYEYCNEVASDITTSGTIETIASGLNPLEAVNRASSFWVIRPGATGTDSNNATWVEYNDSTGAISAVASGSYGIGAGTVYCMKYYK